MLCSISGEAPQHPVASSKSGIVYEKRLIETYIAENHKDPVNGEELETTDLIDLKSSRIVTPRPPTLTSIPSLLSTFQNEWDAIALESFTLRQQLDQVRKELATALYQHDAAIRVIARVTKERDEARDALSKVSVGAGASGNGDAMQIDSEGLPEDLAAKVDATQEKLSKTRKKRPVPKTWVDRDTIEKFGVASSSEELFAGASSLAVDESGDLVVTGGSEGTAGIYSISEKKVQQSFKVGGAVTDAVWYGSQPVVSTTSGAVKVFGDSEATFTSHAGSANALALHPCGDILASVGVDKSFVIYDLVKGRPVTQIYTDSELTTAAFHPDGHLFAAGGADGQIKLFHTKSGENAANFDLGGPVQDVSFSENGIWFAAVAKGSNSVVIFDLRKEGKAAEAEVLEIGGQVDSIRWDYTGQYLAASGPRGLTITQYTKSTKSWSDVISTAVPATAVEWGSAAKTLVTVNGDGIITVLG
ncbi:WD40 repeat-like protein [Glarea lozoyensis ATCC 20868]|uniref:Pre-mRNA-processing factor 19 n=1 Tax=Glarea lozoyensis (strain ATCC 20868 / MF5171) TaxID=1116229 RepID=S3DC13_GLAL2|nr:WD40 repeat-like protein [Glarea lozoyensis ATCC 20868]EPE29531.1 WD40 repeat-like protein [Glarea lozoyensis ATCC 20868]